MVHIQIYGYIPFFFRERTFSVPSILPLPFLFINDITYEKITSSFTFSYCLVR